VPPVPELDLDRIKAATEELDDEAIPDSAWTQRAIRVASRVPALIAEVERLRRLLGDDSFPTSRAYESMATAMQAYRSVAEEMLKHFAQGSFGLETVVSDPVPIETLTRWRQVLGGGS